LKKIAIILAIVISLVFIFFAIPKTPKTAKLVKASELFRVALSFEVIKIEDESYLQVAENELQSLAWYADQSICATFESLNLPYDKGDSTYVKKFLDAIYRSGWRQETQSERTMGGTVIFFNNETTNEPDIMAKATVDANNGSFFFDACQLEN
jgi:hypothetical protein